MLIALVSLEMGIAVIVEAILSFVGLSVSSDTPTWGGMIAQGRQLIHEGAWILAAPLAMLGTPTNAHACRSPRLQDRSARNGLSASTRSVLTRRALRSTFGRAGSHARTLAPVNSANSVRHDIEDGHLQVRHIRIMRRSAYYLMEMHVITP